MVKEMKLSYLKSIINGWEKGIYTAETAMEKVAKWAEITVKYERDESKGGNP
jgi:hypothetical protein